MRTDIFPLIAGFEYTKGDDRAVEETVARQQTHHESKCENVDGRVGEGVEGYLRKMSRFMEMLQVYSIRSMSQWQNI